MCAAPEEPTNPRGLIVGVPVTGPVLSDDTEAAHFRLTVRELQVLAAFASTGTQPSAAHVLGISVQTVKNHCTNAYAKLECHGILEALQAVGWLRVPEEGR